MRDLAAIVARDSHTLRAKDIGTDPLNLDYRPLINGYWEAAADRRALLALLWETRRLIDSINDCHRCLDNSGSEVELELRRSLDALDNLQAAVPA